MNCLPCQGEPSFLTRLGAQVTKKLPWQLSVSAILQEESFDHIYVSTESDAKASSVTIEHCPPDIGTPVRDRIDY